jgi:hypothetical protein
VEGEVRPVVQPINGGVRFTPIRDAEPRLRINARVAHTAGGRLPASASATAVIFAAGYVRVGSGAAVCAGGARPTFKTKATASRVCCAAPTATACATARPAAATEVLRNSVRPAGFARPTFRTFDVYSTSAAVSPRGVLNPSDEELLALVYAARKKRLTHAYR